MAAPDLRAQVAAALASAGVDAAVEPPPPGYAAAGPAPTATVCPADERAVAATVTVARTGGWGLVVRGGGTRDGWGGPLRREPVVVLDTHRLRGLIRHVPADWTAVVRAGTPLAELEAVLRRHGQTLGCIPPGAGRATLGGLIAGDAWGPERLSSGGPRDFTLGLRVVDGAGRAFRTGGQVVKNVSGLDIGKLFVGSGGTLGVLTEAAVRLRPLPEATACWGARRQDAAAAFALARALLSASYQPAGVVLADTTAGALLLAVLLEGSPAQVGGQMTSLRAVGDALPAAEALRCWQSGHEPGTGAELVLRCEVPEGALPDLFASAAETTVPVRRTVWAGLGTLWCAGGTGAGTPPARLLQAARHLRAATEALGGRAILITGPAALRAEFPPLGEPGEMLSLLIAIKGRFDPDGVLGPGRMGWI